MFKKLLCSLNFCKFLLYQNDLYIICCNVLFENLGIYNMELGTY